MDNQNNQNPSDNQNPVSPFGAPSQPLSDANPQAESTFPPQTPPSPQAIPPWPSSLPPIPADTSNLQQPAPQSEPLVADVNQTPSSAPAWPSDALQSSQPEQSSINPPPFTPPPATNEETHLDSAHLSSVPTQTSPWPTSAQDRTATDQWQMFPSSAQSSPDTSSNEKLDPVPTFAPTTGASSTDAKPTGSTPTLSSLDNPWDVPTKTPPIDTTPSPVQPSWITPGPLENQASASPTPVESAPTDLSHLITNNPSQTESAQGSSETLVVPSPPTTLNPEVPTLPTQNHKGIPLWLIGLGVGLLILVAGASAFLILGIGQTNKTTSLPAITNTAEVKPPLPINRPAAAEPSQQPATPGSNNFGQLEGATENSNRSAQATSAGDLLRQGQQ